MKWITLFCGAKNHKENYRVMALEFADWIVKNNYGLIYGGGSNGLMGDVAKRVIERKGHVVGVIPEFMVEKEHAFNGCTELIVVKSMHERKLIMSERGDAFIALPGGFGTLDEICEIITWRQIRILDKPVIFLNFNDYFNFFKKFISHSVEEGFVSDNDYQMIQWINHVVELKSFNI